MSQNYQLWKEKQSQAWTGHGRMQDHSKPAESSWTLLAAGFSLSDKWTLVSVQVGSGIAAAPKTSPWTPLISQNLCCSCSQRGAQGISATVPQVWGPQTECSIFRDSSALEKSLFSSIHEPSEVAHSITHWDHGSGGSCHSLELDRGSQMSPREGAAAAMEQQLVWGRAECPTEGAVRKGSHPVHALKRRKEEPLLPFIFLLLPPSTLSSGKHPCQQLNSWDWGVISHTHTPARPLLVPQHHPPLVCFLKWLILSPFPNEAVPGPSFVRLFCLAEMQGRKEKGVSCFLPFAFKVSQPDYCSSSSKEKTEFIAFVSQLAQFSCFFQCHRTPLMNTNTLSSQKDRDSKIHYLQEIGGSCYKFCAR